MLTTRMVFERFSGDAVAAVMFAQQESKRMPGNELEPVHLFLGVASSPEGTYGALQRCKLSSLSDISQAVEAFCYARAAEEEANAAAAEAAKDSGPMGGLPAGLPNFFGAGAGNNGGASPASPASNNNGKKEKKKGGRGGDAPFSRKSQRTFPRALELAENFGSDVVRSEHLLLAVLEDESVAAVLDDFGVATDDLTAEVCADMESGRGNAELVGAGPPRGKTPTLSECGVDLTEQAREGLLDPVAGRDDETARALQILVRRRKSNPCFIGEPGVGKTAIAEAIAARIASGVSASNHGVFGDRLMLPRPRSPPMYFIFCTVIVPVFSTWFIRLGRCRSITFSYSFLSFFFFWHAFNGGGAPRTVPSVCAINVWCRWSCLRSWQERATAETSKRGSRLW